MPALRSSIFAAAAFAALLCALPAQAALLGPNLYVAGDPFTIEQALDDYAKQRAPQDPKYFKLLVVGNELLRLRSAQLTAELRQRLQKAREDGGQLYVCTKDLKANGLTPGDLPRGVRPVRGFAPEQGGENLASWEKSLPRAPDSKMRGICSGG
jgi:hypothetical protein